MPRKLATLSTVVVVLLPISWSSGAWAQCQPGTLCSQPSPCVTVKCYRQGEWYVAETVNFQVWSDETETATQRSAVQAERLRTELTCKWFGDAADKPWTPRCQIVLHGSRSSYVAAVGQGSEGTLGSSAITFDAGQVIGRRIDLLAADAPFLTNALPHELTHVLLRDRFVAGVLPRWADEGMAMVADPEAKQARHLRDLRTAMANSKEFSAAELLTMHDYPRSDRRQAFYGQSVFVANLLIARKSPRQFVTFLERAVSIGYDEALEEIYGIAGLADLDRLWRRNLYEVRLASNRDG